ncbi:MAG TPA: DNA cytosine methyltransferase [Gemmatimonadaceae bacterium]|nr:DNA cytosine methyltransferase [Gemmatimonadaceae bacterium]
MTRGLVVDSFAGGGGASLGIEMALGRSPDIAINHDREAIALHKANHPRSRHYPENVWAVDPVAACQGRPIDLMWLSPDCTHFSKAKGGKPVKKKIRGLAWVAVRWAKAVRPSVIILENVEEFKGWGPVSRETGQPRPDRKGETFRAFVRKLERLGYEVEWRELRACDYGAPTIRKRFFLIARCDGRPITWPSPTHGKGTPRPWHAAAECIDWSIACPSIFLTKREARALHVRRPLADATLRRIARGIRRFVLESPKPFIVPTTHAGDARFHSIDEPMRTITGAHRGEHALIAPSLIQSGYGEDKKRNGGDGQPPRCLDIEAPLGTVVGQNVKHALVSAFLAKHYGGHETPGCAIDGPLSTVTTQDHHHLVASHLVKLYGTCRDGQQLDLPMATVRAQGNHIAEVRAFLMTYYGTKQKTGDLSVPVPTVTAKDRLGLVTVEGTEYAIADIGMRMLAPRELYRAQSFPDSYVIDIEFKGKPLSKEAQVRMCGNSVPPVVARAIVRANIGDASAEVAA